MIKVLIVMTNTSEMGENVKTGVWYGEFATPYIEFLKTGYEVTVASPAGGEIPIDPNSIKSEKTEEDILNVLKNSEKLENINSEDFDCIFIPGGHGCMFDLPDNKNLAKIIEDLSGERKVISAICHGVCGLLGAKKKNGEPYVKGKTLTSFTNAEEKLSGYEKYMPFLLETRLKEAGAHYMEKLPFTSFTVEDGFLITGQNQNSAKELAGRIVEKSGRTMDKKTLDFEADEDF